MIKFDKKMVFVLFLLGFFAMLIMLKSGSPGMQQGRGSSAVSLTSP
jgi:hypothetical protein